MTVELLTARKCCCGPDEPPPPPPIISCEEFSSVCELPTALTFEFDISINAAYRASPTINRRLIYTMNGTVVALDANEQNATYSSVPQAQWTEMTFFSYWGNEGSSNDFYKVGPIQTSDYVSLVIQNEVGAATFCTPGSSAGLRDEIWSFQQSPRVIDLPATTYLGSIQIFGNLSENVEMRIRTGCSIEFQFDNLPFTCDSFEEEYPIDPSNIKLLYWTGLGTIIFGPSIQNIIEEVESGSNAIGDFVELEWSASWRRVL